MHRNDIVNDYFNWLYRFVCGSKSPKKGSYRRLLKQLHDIEFTYIIPMDGNRAEDGIDLRYRFGVEFDIPKAIIASYLDCQPCSVLEMMVALSLRIEETIMSDPEMGDRVANWFWEMMGNLSLDDMDNRHHDPDGVEESIDIFLNRKYRRNGTGGGPFVINKPKTDIRKVEIWYQAMWHLDEVLKQNKV